MFEHSFRGGIMATQACSRTQLSEPLRQIITFLVLMTIGSAIMVLIIYQAGGLRAYDGTLVHILMWMPGLAGLITSFAYTRNFRELGLNTLEPARYLLIGYLVPVAYLLITYAIVWVTGLGILNTDAATQQVPLWAFLFDSATNGVARALFSTAGEEIGWRGLLTCQMFRLTSFTRTALITGVIWWVWHLPLMPLGYSSGTPLWYAVPCFLIAVVGISFVQTYLRLKSGSVWPCILLHASHNLFIQGIFEPLTKNAGFTPYLTTEFGIATAIALAVVGVIFWRLGKRLDAAQNSRGKEFVQAQSASVS
jgi:membrane protease YdiL (CAAX protease family)